jgi:N-acyl-D-aspartate/D-glutamate deacylase
MKSDRWDVVIRGARVFDGTGAAPFIGSLAVRGDRIAAMGEVEGDASVEIDARELALAPGFIDVHSHDDFAVLTTPAMDFKLMQGVTTEVIGNCGMGAAPYEALSEHFGTFFGDMVTSGWEGYRGYLEMVEHAPPSLNVAMLVGHNTVRAAVMGMAHRAPTQEEQRAMRELVREGLEAGAVGFSTGLIYEPGRHCATEEVIELARDVAAAGVFTQPTCETKPRACWTPCGKRFASVANPACASRSRITRLRERETGAACGNRLSLSSRRAQRAST